QSTKDAASASSAALADFQQASQTQLDALSERFGREIGDLRAGVAHGSEAVAEPVDALGGLLLPRLRRARAISSGQGSSAAGAQRASLPAIPSICFWSFDLDAEWRGWRTHQASELGASGTVVVLQDASTPGVESDAIDTAGPGLLEVSVRAE